MTEFEITVLAALARVEATQVEILRRLDSKQRGRAVLGDDVSMLEKLLPGVGGKLGSEEFTVFELFQDSTFRALMGNRTPAQVGSVLARSAGRNVAGYVIEVIGKVEGNKTLWQVKKSLGS